MPLIQPTPSPVPLPPISPVFRRHFKPVNDTALTPELPVKRVARSHAGSLSTLHFENATAPEDTNAHMIQAWAHRHGLQPYFSQLPFFYQQLVFLTHLTHRDPHSPLVQELLWSPHTKWEASRIPFNPNSSHLDTVSHYCGNFTSNFITALTKVVNVIAEAISQYADDGRVLHQRYVHNYFHPLITSGILPALCSSFTRTFYTSDSWQDFSSDIPIPTVPYGTAVTTRDCDSNLHLFNSHSSSFHHLLTKNSPDCSHYPRSMSPDFLPPATTFPLIQNPFFPTPSLTPYEHAFLALRHRTDPDEEENILDFINRPLNSLYIGCLISGYLNQMLGQMFSIYEVTRLEERPEFPAPPTSSKDPLHIPHWALNGCTPPPIFPSHIHKRVAEVTKSLDFTRQFTQALGELIVAMQPGISDWSRTTKPLTLLRVTHASILESTTPFTPPLLTTDQNDPAALNHIDHLVDRDLFLKVMSQDLANLNLGTFLANRICDTLTVSAPRSIWKCKASVVHDYITRTLRSTFGSQRPLTQAYKHYKTSTRNFLLTLADPRSGIGRRWQVLHDLCSSITDTIDHPYTIDFTNEALKKPNYDWSQNPDLLDDPSSGGTTLVSPDDGESKVEPKDEKITSPASSEMDQDQFTYEPRPVDHQALIKSSIKDLNAKASVIRLPHTVRTTEKSFHSTDFYSSFGSEIDIEKAQDFILGTSTDSSFFINEEVEFIPSPLQTAGVLIDASGSMGFSPASLIHLAKTCAFGLVAYYSGGVGSPVSWTYPNSLTTDATTPDRSHGPIFIFSENGHHYDAMATGRARQEPDGYIPNGPGGNAIDLAALRWFLSVPGLEPRIMITDMGFCGGAGDTRRAFALARSATLSGQLTILETSNTAAAIAAINHYRLHEEWPSSAPIYNPFS